MEEQTMSSAFNGEYAEIGGPLGDILIPQLPKSALARQDSNDLLRRYRASFVLTTPEVLVGVSAWTIGVERGDSHIILGDEQGTSYEGYSVVPNSYYSIHFYFLGNEAGRLGRITSDDFGAENIEEAMVWASDAISSTLSFLSVLHDAPLYVGQIELFRFARPPLS